MCNRIDLEGRCAIVTGAAYASVERARGRMLEEFVRFDIPGQQRRDRRTDAGYVRVLRLRLATGDGSQSGRSVPLPRRRPAHDRLRLRPHRQHRLDCRQGGQPRASAYSASKAALIALTKSLGKEPAAYDIGANCITPSSADTTLLRQFSPDFVTAMLAKVPRGRFVRVEEIAAMAAFCASAECSFTTGAVFDISGRRATY